VSEQTQLQGETSLEQEPPDEQELALKQWLRQIPEDPAGLLRRKFMVEHLTRMRNAQ
jgi:Ca-activated chloride channel family protein